MGRAPGTAELSPRSARVAAVAFRRRFSCVPARLQPVPQYARCVDGRTDVFHATNFVLPPTRRAAGVLTIHDLSFLRNADTVTRDVLAYQRLVSGGPRPS